MRADLGQLIESGRISDARKLLAGRSALSNAEKLARCLVEAASGNEAAAFEQASDLASRALPADILVEALALTGRVDYAKGRWVDGANRFGRAKQIAKDSQNKALIARAIASHTEALLHFFTLDSAVTHVRQLRETAVRAGTADHLFEYRVILAEMESRLGERIALLANSSLLRCFYKPPPVSCAKRDGTWSAATLAQASETGVMHFPRRLLHSVSRPSQAHLL